MSEPDREDRKARRPIDKLSIKGRHLSTATPETQQRHGNRGPLNRRSRSEDSTGTHISQIDVYARRRCGRGCCPGHQ